MTQETKESVFSVHQYYMEILNGIPSIVYWVDEQAQLKGCNRRFVEMLGLNSLQDLTGTVYSQLRTLALWSEQRVERCRLDDMAALFSGQPSRRVDEDYRTSRVPLLDAHKKTVGLVVVMDEVEAFRVQEPRPAVWPLPSLDPGPARVLVVEDNPVAQSVERAILLSLDCQVDVAASGAEALLLFAVGKYDLVLMDIGLADTSGYIVAKRLRQQEQNSQHRVPIIALTTYDPQVVQQDCREYLMDGVISKPLSTDQAKLLLKAYLHHEAVTVPGLSVL